MENVWWRDGRFCNWPQINWSALLTSNSPECNHQIRFSDFYSFCLRNSVAGLGLVDTLPREGMAPQGGVKDTWIFPPNLLLHLQCFLSSIALLTSYCWLAWHREERTGKEIPSIWCQRRARWCQTMPPSDARWLRNAISYHRPLVTELNGMPGYLPSMLTQFLWMGEYSSQWFFWNNTCVWSQSGWFFFDTILVWSQSGWFIRASYSELGHSEWLTGRKPNEWSRIQKTKQSIRKIQKTKQLIRKIQKTKKPGNTFKHTNTITLEENKADHYKEILSYIKKMLSRKLVWNRKPMRADGF